MKSPLTAALLALGLAACGSADKLPPYDERPANHAPAEQTAWARDLDYDILDYESYNSYCGPYVVDEPDGQRVSPEWWMRLYKAPEATYLAETFYIPQDYWYFNFASESAIIDAKTGDNYMLREVEYYPTDTCFWIRNAAGQYVRFVLVYPPLAEGVEDIDIFTPALPSRDTFDGSAQRLTGLKVSDLRRSTLQKSNLKKGEVIY